MVYKLTDNELRNLCREKLESLEHWLRRLIDETLTAEYGDYFSLTDSSGSRIIKKNFVDALENRMSREPDRYKRKIDAVLLDDAIDVLCKPSLYEFFKPAFVGAFPEGRDEARTFLKRLIEPRNRLAHANAISQRQAEQVICYSNDVIDSLRLYYAAIGMHQEYNVPLILKVIDSFGNVFYRNQMSPSHINWLHKNLTTVSQCFLRPGDTLTVEVEVDPAFDRSEYTVSWRISPSQNPFQMVSNDLRVELHLSVQHVTESLMLECRIKSNQQWHRMGSEDDRLTLNYKVLPPI